MGDDRYEMINVGKLRCHYNVVVVVVGFALWLLRCIMTAARSNRRENRCRLRRRAAGHGPTNRGVIYPRDNRHRRRSDGVRGNGRLFLSPAVQVQCSRSRRKRNPESARSLLFVYRLKKKPFEAAHQFTDLKGIPYFSNLPVDSGQVPCRTHSTRESRVPTVLPT